MYSIVIYSLQNHNTWICQMWVFFSSWYYKPDEFIQGWNPQALKWSYPDACNCIYHTTRRTERTHTRWSFSCALAGPTKTNVTLWHYKAFNPIHPTCGSNQTILSPTNSHSLEVQLTGTHIYMNLKLNPLTKGLAVHLYWNWTMLGYGTVQTGDIVIL